MNKVFLTDRNIEVIKDGLNYSKDKNDEILFMVGEGGDPEADEIDNVICNLLEKLDNEDGGKEYEFSDLEFSEIRIGVLGLLTQDIGNKEVRSVLVMFPPLEV